MMPSRIFMAKGKHLFRPALNQSGSKASVLKIYREVHPQGQLPVGWACKKSFTQVEVLRKETIYWKKQMEKQAWTHCKFFPQPHSISEKLLFAGTQQRRALVLNTSSLHTIHIKHHFPSCLITAMTFCPDLKPHVELSLQTPSCSRIKPDTLLYSNKLLQPDSLANHPRTWMNKVEVCPLSKLVSPVFQGSFLDHVRKLQIRLKPGVSCICLAGR